MARLRELIAHSDIVINNLRPGAMERQGLGYRAAQGDQAGHHLGVDQDVGQRRAAWVIKPATRPVSPRWPGSPRWSATPVGRRWGRACATGIPPSAPLPRMPPWWRCCIESVSGAGQFVDVSAVETLSSMIGDCLLEQSLTGKRLGARRQQPSRHVPARLLSLRGGSWVSVAVADDAEWQRLCEVLDAATLSADPRYSTLGQRRDHIGALDADLARLTRRPRRRGTRAPTAGGGRAGGQERQRLVDVIGDQRLWDRELYRFVSDHREGQRPILGPSWRMTRDPARIARGAPDLGEDTDYVLHEILSAGSRRGRGGQNDDADAGEHGRAGHRRQQRYRRGDGEGAGRSRAPRWRCWRAGPIG